MTMSRCRSVLAALICAVLSACAATTALESQNKPLTARVARIYILRPGALAGAAAAATVKINGLDVGAVATNSYLSVDRPAGRYKIYVSLWGELGKNEHEIDVAAGRTYYYAINMHGTAVAAAGTVIFFDGPKVGRSVGQSNLLSGGYLAEVDAAQAAAAMSRMKPP